MKHYVLAFTFLAIRKYPFVQLSGEYYIRAHANCAKVRNSSKSLSWCTCDSGDRHC